MAEKISVQIELDGGAEVESQLADIGATGNKAFAETSRAADSASQSVSNFSAQTVKTSLEITKLTAEIAKIGVEIGLTIARHRSWVSELLHLASSANTAVKALGLIAPELAVMGTALAAGTVALAGAAVAFEVVEKAATAAAKGYGELNQSLKTLASNSGQSFKSLQQGRAAFEQLGISGEKFNGIITKISESIAGLDVGGKIKEQADQAKEATNKILEAERELIALRQKSEGRELTFAETGRLKEIEQLIDKTGALETAEKKVGDARDKATQQSANSLATLLPIIQQIETGQKGITFDSLVTAEGKINAVAASLKQAEAAGQNAGQVLVNFIAAADRLTAVKVGAAFGITEADVDRIRNLGGQLGVVDEIWKRIQGAGVLIPPDSAAAFDRMQVSIQGADAAYARFQQALQSSAFAALAADASAVLNDIKTAFFNTAAAVVEAFNQVASAVSSGIANTKREFETLGALLTSLGAALVKVFTDPIVALNDLIAGVQRLINKFLEWLGLKGASGGGGGGGDKTPGMASGGLLGGHGTGTSDSNLAWVSRGEHIMPASVVRRPGVLSFLETLRRSGGIPGFAEGGLTDGGTSSALIIAPVLGRLAKQLSDIANSIFQIMEPYMQSVVSFMQTAQRMDSSMAGVQRAIRSVVDELVAMENAINVKRGMAGGGLLGGRGTGTSDSNLAWVSRGEYITPARAVAQPGVLSFLEALRRSGGNLSRVLNGMGRFALGGLVPQRMGIPSYAAGGLAGGSNVTIQFPGLPAISGLRASSDVVDQLHRAAALAQVRSGGRKPSRYS